MIYLIIVVSLIPFANSDWNSKKTVCNTKPCYIRTGDQLNQSNIRVRKRETDQNGELMLTIPSDAEIVSVNFKNQTQESLKNRNLGAFIKAVGAVSGHISGPNGVAVIGRISNLETELADYLWGNPSSASVTIAQLTQTVKLDKIVAGKLIRVTSTFFGKPKEANLIQIRNEIYAGLGYMTEAKMFPITENERRYFANWCQSRDFHFFPLIFKNELNIDNRTSNTGLARKYIDDMDQNRYLLFAAEKVLFFAEAANLQYECTGAIRKNSSDLNSTLELYMKQNAKYWKEMQIEMMKAQETFEKNVLNHVEDFVETYTLQHMTKNALELHEDIFFQLSNKYYWRKWFLLVRDDLKGGMKDSKGANNSVQENDILWYKRWDNLAGKTIVLSSPKIGDPKKCPYNTGCSESFSFRDCPILILRKRFCYVCSACNF